jgi:hypothetical protein
MISGRVSKSRFPVGKMHRNVIKNYLKPVARKRYRIGLLQDESKRFVLFGLRLRICTAHVDHPFLKLSTQNTIACFDSTICARLHDANIHVYCGTISLSCCMTMLVMRDGGYCKINWFSVIPVFFISGLTVRLKPK